MRADRAVWIAVVFALLTLSCGGSGSKGDAAPTLTVGVWAPAASMQTARAGHSATMLPSGLVLVAGGIGAAGGELASAELFDPASGTWRSAGAMPVAVEGHRAVVVPGGVLVVGGGVSVVSGAVSPRSTAALYDSAAGTWRSVAAMSAPRYGHTATVLATGRVLVTGGNIDPAHPTPTAELYDPATETWTAAAPLLTARAYHEAVLLPSGKVLVTAGATSAAPSELYDPVTNAWAPAAAMPWAAEDHTLTLLASGKVLAAGGVQGNGGEFIRLRNAALYDPATDTWTATSRLNHARGNHGAALLPSGKVLVVGGGHDVVKAGSEVFDPATGGWQDTAAMLVEHGDAAAITVLPSGRALATGGYAFVNASGAMASAETFGE